MYNNLKYSILIFVVSPLTAAVLFLFSRNYFHVRFILYLFFIIYGLTFYYTESNDSYRHYEDVILYYTDMSFSDFATDMGSILRFEFTDSGVVDLYKHILSYVCGSILNMPFLFFPIVSIIYGLFFIGSCSIILREFSVKERNVYIIFFVLLFLILKNVEGINTVRTWTGMWFLIYVVLKYLYSRKRKYLYLVFLAPFFHIGYLAITLPVIISLYLKPSVYVSFYILVMSIGVNDLGLNSIFSKFSSSFEVIDHRYENYRVDRISQSKGTVLLKEKNNRIYKTLRQRGLHKVGLYILLATIVILYGRVLAGDSLGTLWLFTSINIFTFSNIFSFISEVGARSYMVGEVLFFGFFIYFLTRYRSVVLNNKNFLISLRMSIVLLLPYFIFNLSRLLDHMSIYLLAIPYLGFEYFELNMSIKELFRLFT